MLKLFLSSVLRAIYLWLAAGVSPWTQGRKPIGTLLVIVAWPAFCVLQLLHWIGFGLDELFFRGWRNVEVEQPLFVLGPPRSGTTHLHHVLSADAQTTTFRTWECLFGLSITARKLLLALGRIDRWVGRPLERLGGAVSRRLLSDMEEVHPFSMDAPEEDFLALMPAMQCFILVAVFPRAEWLWRNARLDQQAGPTQRRRLMRYYKACVQKHMYVFGRDKRFLSKNASFSGMPEALLETFPGARIMACTRDPKKTVPSQMSSLLPGLAAVGFESVDTHLRDRLMALLKFYYLHLDRVAAEYPRRVVIIDNQRLRDDLAAVLQKAYRQLDLNMSEQFSGFLQQADRRSRGFESGHRYTLEAFGLTEADIENFFSEVYRRQSFQSGSARQASAS
ncbi:MAG: sulfotransferase [Wenzhouxiangellaceae bacterium]|nr:sulfotransferase [Wenzhouxiangellaceae bacterium]